MKHSVEISEEYLLQIATCGKMGSGELTEMMRLWAERECNRLGLSGKLLELQIAKVKELRESLRNIIGDDNIKVIDKSISVVTCALKSSKTIGDV